MHNLTNPRVADVVVTPDPEDARYVTVDAVWAVDGGTLDRPNVGGWLTTKALAVRLERALRDGAVYSKAEVCTDVHGNTYVHGTSRVLGRMMNADLNRLGY